MRGILTRLAAALACLAAINFKANAGPVGATITAQSEFESPYHAGGWEIQAVAGPFWDLEVYSDQPTFDYVLESLRIGYMITGARGHGWSRGNLELLLDASGGQFFRGPVNYLIGGNVLLRWNFLQVAHPKWVPYFQLGAGGLAHDARDVDTRAQATLGSNVEAMLHADLGTRYHITEKWSIDGEVGYRHISNANTSAHNRGLNSLGGQFGLSYFF
jgi:lipid A 3-O-deacylase PagL